MTTEAEHREIAVVFVATPTEATCGCGADTGIRSFHPVDGHTDEPLCADCVRAAGSHGEPLLRLLTAMDQVDAAVFLVEEHRRDDLATVAVTAYQQWAGSRFGYLIDQDQDDQGGDSDN